jgi:hypothetical protein
MDNACFSRASRRLQALLGGTVGQGKQRLFAMNNLLKPNNITLSSGFQLETCFLDQIVIGEEDVILRYCLYPQIVQ